MSEHLSKKALLESIDAEQIRLMGEYQSVTGYHKRYVTGKYDGLNWIKHQIESGAFDAEQIELQRLRVAITAMRQAVWDELVPIKLATEINKIADEALSTTSEPTNKYFGAEWPKAKESEVK